MSVTLNAQLLRDYMKRNAKTREWVAVQLGISGSLVSKMLAGDAPRPQTTEKLAQLIGCQVSDLLIAQEDGKRPA